MSMPGFWEILTLAVLALLIFGPEKLPGMARTIGRTVSQFRREAQEALDELKRAADVEELRKVGEELKSTASELKTSAMEIEREAASASSAATRRPPGGTIAAGDGARPGLAGAGVGAGGQAGDGHHTEAAALAGPPPFDPDAT